jgi:hypothetical protein
MATKNILIILGVLAAIVIIVLVTKPKKNDVTTDSQTDSMNQDSIPSEASTSLENDGNENSVSSTEALDSNVEADSPTFPHTGFEAKN